MSYFEIKIKKVKLRKKHFCDWCGESILKGEEAMRRVYVFYSDFHDTRQHPECFNAMQNADLEVLAEGWSRGDFDRPSVK